MRDDDEMILVVERERLDEIGLIQGLDVGRVDEYIAIIGRSGKYIKKAAAEETSSVKQVVVYCVATYNGAVLLFRRRGDGEAAPGLEDKYSLGVGGHVSRDDMADGVDAAAFMRSAQREFREEVVLIGDESKPPRFTLIGVVNDDTNGVGQKHIGLVYDVAVPGPLAVRSGGELADDSASLVPVADLARFANGMENWSVLIAEHLAVTRTAPSSA